MKTVKSFAYFMAVAMVSTVGMVSCKDKNAPEETPQQNTELEEGSTGVVKTEFSISMPAQLSPNRMPSKTVQNAGMEEFQGMTGITLLPFSKQVESPAVPETAAPVVSGDTRLGANIVLSEDLDKTDVDGKASQAKVYSNIDIPLTTASFLFYAKSKAPGTKFQAGSLKPTPADLDANPADIVFDLEKIQASASTDMLSGTASGKKLMDYLTSIANASDGQTTPKLWREYTETDDAAMKAMFDNFVSVKYLSSFGVERMLTDLYKSLKPVTSPIATGIKAAIDNPAYATVNASDEVELIAELDNFPAEFNLPNGAVSLAWNVTEFIQGPYSNMAALETYVYPAQLWYYVNSAIKTSNTSKKTMYDNTSIAWSDILDAHTDAVSVNSLTRAVAIYKKIQYAVARLDVAVKLNAASLADNSEAAEGIAKAVDCSAGFPITGILVGGQQQVKFDFTTNGGTEYTIYDNAMADGAMKAISGSLSAYNHTLVLENGTSNVRIAVEMVNNTTKDFYGYGNQLIPAGGKFYVIAELDASAATETGGHVFKQDYKTTANLTLQNLKNAYNTIPDLRTPKLELGFSVDLTWQAGHVYNINF